MKEIKAYVRPETLGTLVKRLEGAGAKDMTVIRVDALAALADWRAGIEGDFWQGTGKFDGKYSKIAKLDIVCRDADVSRFLETIRTSCCTGQKGDGRIFVSNVEWAVNIRTGQQDEEAL